MSKTKIIIIVSSILLTAVIVWYFFFKKTKPATKPPLTISPLPTNTNSTTISSTVSNDLFPLKTGSKGANVKTLQGCLNTLKPSPYLDLVEDGDFGAHTQSRLTQMFGDSFYPLTETNFDMILSRANSNLSIYNN